ncbi:hypothetical protein C8K30_11515 [Promicromonospora sp. AC04]|uniref:hypothetical protein n=1 Tax=Promicromonospora sp. AC04 TaxID=2135723 RepID=UPI000D4BB303|nr:hypothetical protein [Promicromonospora sp. AC04]PUB20804.1 hypothetical protein C8K30_11515 [Promicromonospora sp. AC04]
MPAHRASADTTADLATRSADRSEKTGEASGEAPASFTPFGDLAAAFCDDDHCEIPTH